MNKISNKEKILHEVLFYFNTKKLHFLRRINGPSLSMVFDLLFFLRIDSLIFVLFRRSYSEYFRLNVRINMKMSEGTGILSVLCSSFMVSSSSSQILS